MKPVSKGSSKNKTKQKNTIKCEMWESQLLVFLVFPTDCRDCAHRFVPYLEMNEIIRYDTENNLKNHIRSWVKFFTNVVVCDEYLTFVFLIVPNVPEWQHCMGEGDWAKEAGGEEGEERETDRQRTGNRQSLCLLTVLMWKLVLHNS